MADQIDSVINITNILYRVPTLHAYTGETGAAFINPKSVSALETEEITIGEEDISSKTIKGTRVVTPNEIYFVPLSVIDVADKLNIDLRVEQEATA